MSTAVDTFRNAFADIGENRQVSLDEIGGTKTFEPSDQGLISLSSCKGSWSTQNWDDGLGYRNTRTSHMISKSPEEAQKIRVQLTKGISHKGCESPTRIVMKRLFYILQI